MCVEDVVISRGTYLVRTAAAANGTVNLKANIDRVAVSVALHAFTTSRAMISTTTDDTNGSVGVQIAAAITGAGAEKIGQAGFSIDYKQYPGMVQGELTVTAIGGAFTVYEHIMTSDLARAVRRQEDKLLHGG